MRNINRDLKIGDVVRLRKNIMEGDFRFESSVGWVESMEQLIGKKVVVRRINGKRSDGLSFAIVSGDFNRELVDYGYSSNWFEHVNSIDDEVEEL